MRSHWVSWLLVPLLGFGLVWNGGMTGAIAQEKVKKQESEADLLFEQGGQAFEQGKYDQARQSWEKALLLYRAMHDLKGEGNVLLNMGAIYRSEPEKSLPLFEKALSIFRTLRDRNLEALTLANLSDVYQTQARYDRAIEVAQQALSISREVNDKYVETNALNNLSSAYFESKQFNKTIESCLELLSMYREAKDNYRIIRTLKRLSDSYFAISEYEKSISYTRETIDIYRLDNDITSEVNALVKIGNIYRKASNLDQAVFHYKKGLEIARRNQSTAETNALFELGQTALRTDDYEQAVKYFEQVINHPSASTALEEFSLSDYRQYYIGSLAHLGDIYLKLGNYSKSLTYLEEASKLISATPVSDETFFTYFNLRLGIYSDLSSTLNRLGQFDKAIETTEREISVARVLKSRSSEAVLVGNLGNTYYLQGKSSDARKQYLESLKISQEYGFSAIKCLALSGLGNISSLEGKVEESIDFYKQSIVIAEKNGDYSGVGLLLNNLGDSFLSKGDFPKAEEYFQKSIEISKPLLERLSDSQRISLCDVCEQSKPFSLLQIAQVAQNKFEAALQTSEKGRARAFHKAFTSSLLKRGGQALISNLQSQEFSIPQIQKVAAAQNATLVQYSTILDKELYIYVIQPNGKISFRTADLTTIGQSVRQFVNASRTEIGARGRSDIDVALAPEKEQELQQQRDRSLRKLHQLLIEPIADLLPKNENDRVIFLPQGELFLVPFPALLNYKNQPLITQHTILTAPSIQTLDLTHKAAKALPKGNRPSLVVGNPTMPAVTTIIGEPPHKLRNLSGSKAEAEAIAQQLHTTAITGSDAKKDAIVQRMQNAGVIHLATHGLLDSFKGDAPGAIALAPNGTNQPNDGLLTTREIFDLKLNAELVVLSACDTGRGDITGDGVIGLSRSLFVAGVPSVIVSLWKVPDESTAFLMTEFYRNWKDRKLDKAQALRQAMLTTRSKYHQPLDWAAFTLIGEAE